MAEVKYRSSTNAKKIASTKFLTTLPAGAVAGDLGILCLNAAVATVTWVKPSGWTLVAESEATSETGGKHSWAIYQRQLTGVEAEDKPELEVTASATMEYTYVAVEKGTYDTTTPIDGHSVWKESPSAEPLEFVWNDGKVNVVGGLSIIFSSQNQVPVGFAGYTKQNEGASIFTYTKENMATGEVVGTGTKSTKTPYHGYFVNIRALGTTEASPETMLV